MSEGSKRVKESVGGKRANNRILEWFWGVLGEGAELHRFSYIFFLFSSTNQDIFCYFPCN